MVFDFRGTTDVSKEELKSTQQIVKILGDYYPEKTDFIYLLGANWFFKILFSIVKLFMDKKTV